MNLCNDNGLPPDLFEPVQLRKENQELSVLECWINEAEKLIHVFQPPMHSLGDKSMKLEHQQMLYSGWVPG